MAFRAVFRLLLSGQLLLNCIWALPKSTFNLITPLSTPEFDLRSPFWSGPLTEIAHRSDPSLYRLPNSTKPQSYKITLFVDPNKRDFFAGKVAIDVLAKQATKSIYLHAKRIEIGKDDLRVVHKASGKELQDGFDMETNDIEFLQINLKEELIVGDGYEIFINYVGKYGDALDGLYLSSYIDESNNTRYLATTQFEATSARAAFPCYDEPGLKSTFQVNIYVPKGYNAISNMDEMESDLPPMDNYRSVSFRKSPPMSTYTLAFVISDFDFKSNHLDGPLIYSKEFRVYAKPASRSKLDYALEVGQKILKELIRYTGVDYRMPKMDNVAVPDFAAGAMENWGIVTYRQQYLFYDETTSPRFQQFIVEIMSHEFAHMFFGNEVSPEFWDCVWLSEGFATYFQTRTTDLVYDGKWRAMEQFVATYMELVMIIDSQPNTRAMTNPVASPKEISSNFNAISYPKAGSVIRMMQHVLTEDSFRLGLNLYLSSLPTGAARPEMLFNSLHSAIAGQESKLLPRGATVADVFGSWSNQKGFPVIYATRDGDKVELMQKRYFQRQSYNSSEKWYVPITWVTSKSPQFDETTAKLWLTPNDDTVVFDIEKGSDWYILNLQQAGYYRVMYDKDNWNNLVEALLDNHTEFHVLNRAQMLDDVIDFSRSSRLSFNYTLNTIRYLRKETDYIPWIVANRVISLLNVMMPASKHYDRYLHFVDNILELAYYNLGFESKSSDEHIDKLHRRLLINLACDSKSSGCLKDANRKLEDVKEKRVAHIDSDMEQIVYCSGLKNGDVSQWDFMLNKYLDDSKRDSRILYWLGCSRNGEIVDRYLKMSIDESSSIEKNRRHHIVLAVMDSGAFGVDRALDFVYENYSEIEKRFTSNQIDAVFSAFAYKIITRHQADSFKSFTEKYPETTKLDSVQNTLKVNERVQMWLAPILEDVDPWLFENVILDY